MTGQMHPLPSNKYRSEGHMSSAMYHAPSLIIGSLESIESVRAPQFLPSSRCDALARSKYAMRSRSEKKLSKGSPFHNTTFTYLPPGTLILYRYLLDFRLYGTLISHAPKKIFT